MKRLYKNLIYIILGLIFISLYLMAIDKFYWSLLILIISTGLILIEKRKDIQSFFITSKFNLLDKWLICVVCVLVMLMFIKDLFVEDVGKKLHWNLLTLGIIIISGLILKRTLIKNLFKKEERKGVKTNNEKFTNAKLNKIRLLNKRIQYALMIIFAFLILMIFLDSRNKIQEHNSKHLFILILIIMFVLIAIYEYKKKSINKG